MLMNGSNYGLRYFSIVMRIRFSLSVVAVTKNLWSSLLMIRSIPELIRMPPFCGKLRPQQVYIASLRTIGFSSSK